MYLGGMIAERHELTVDQLNGWAESAAGLQMISEYTIPWLAVEHPRPAPWRFNGSTRPRNTLLRLGGALTPAW